MIYWYKKVLNQYADFEGRARRTEYWMFTLMNFLIILPLYIVIIIGSTSENTILSGVGIGLVLIYSIAMIIPSIAVAVRRLHDTGNSGWMYFISMIPLIGAIWLLVLYVTEGDRGDNQYGPDPKA